MVTWAEIIQEAADPIKARYRDFAPDEWQTLYSKFSQPEDFADRVVDPASPAAATTRRAMIQAWTDWNASEKPPVDPLASLYGLKAHIARAIGATAWRPAHAQPWHTGEMISSPDGYIFETPRGGVFLDATVINHKAVWMSEMSVERRGGGLGTAVMHAIHDFAIRRHLAVKVFKVTNTQFFDRFAWLRRSGDSCFNSICNAVPNA